MEAYDEGVNPDDIGKSIIYVSSNNITVKQKIALFLRCVYPPVYEVHARKRR